MAQFTLATRVSDGFILMESNEPIHGSSVKDQAKAIARRLEQHSPARLSADSGTHQISYLMEDGICFLVVTDAAYPRRLTFCYLSSLHREFTAYLRDLDGEGWRSVLGTTARAYAYQGFASSKLQQLKREYADPQSKSNTVRLTEELQDVHSIMRKNISEVLQRGENLDREFLFLEIQQNLATGIAQRCRRRIIGECSLYLSLSLTHTHTHTRKSPLFLVDLSRVSSKLAADSKSFKWGAKKLNLMDAMRKWAPCMGILLFIVVVLLWRSYF